MIPPEQRETRQQPPGLLRGQGAALDLAENLLGIDPAPKRRHLADRVGVNRALVHRELEDPQRQRSAVRHRRRPDLPRQLRLPTTHVSRGDLVDRPVGEPRAHMQPQPTLRGGEGGGAGIVGGPGVPPLGRPGAERQPAALASSPGAPAHLQPLLGSEVAGLVGDVDGLAALGAVVESPGDQVAVAAPAPAHRTHQGPPEADWRTAFGGPGRRGASAGRWAPLAARHDS